MTDDELIEQLIELAEAQESELQRRSGILGRVAALQYRLIMIALLTGLWVGGHDVLLGE